MSSWVIPMSADPRCCGNKAAALARLAAAGLPTPGGFVVSAAAFAALVPSRELVEPLRGRPRPDLALLGSVDARAAEVIAGLPWPARLRADLRARRSALGPADLPLAVRSSATWEDTASHSAAGQLRSAVGVTGDDALQAAVAHVWAGAFSPAAITHRLRTGAPAEPGPVAVMIQPLAAAVLSGVAYSAHPVTGDPSVLVVEAVAGLGGPLVDGRVVPEHVELARDGRPLTRRPARQQVTAVHDPVAGAVVERPHTGPVDLTPGRLGVIREALLQAEAVFARPVDIEWCWAPGPGLTLVQARPITAL